jgi:uncharacterized membrane protein YoaK (UPF0700 family)
MKRHAGSMMNPDDVPCFLEWIMKFATPVALSLEAGYVDTAGFLALQGLFTAHVTGNFVTIGAALVFGSSGIVTKLAALPVFCIVVLAVRLASYRLSEKGEGQLQSLLLIKLALLIVAAVVALRFGPFPNADTAAGFITGVTLVSAMAIQNGLQRIYLGKAPPTTMMTGTSTQIMLDVGDLVRGVTAAQKSEILARMRPMAANVLAFAVGCALAAWAYRIVGMWCFVLPPLLTTLTLWSRRYFPEPA